MEQDTAAERMGISRGTFQRILYSARRKTALALTEGRATPECYQAADEAMSGVTNVGNCVYFRTPIPGLTGISIGGHIFY